MAEKQSMNECPICCTQYIDACLICMKLMLSDSQFSGRYAALCAEVCEWCAEQCKEHDHEHCKECAATYLVCVQECRKLAA